jgi:GTPase SAR1 family protein
MGKYCQLVIGPAGSGKSTFCETIQQHGENIGRTIHVINLDPAAESFKYNCAAGMRLLSLHVSPQSI